jgi:two-component system chemotaxis response regulator CheY
MGTMIDLEDELAEEYLAECRENLAAIETDLVSIERDKADIEAPVDRLFRAVHAIKQGAGYFDLTKIRELANQAEDVLALIRSGKMALTTDGIGILLRATDRLHDLIEQPGLSNQTDITDVMAPLAGLIAKDFASESARSLRVLLVEDDFASRLLLQTFLSRYGECHVAANGKEATEAFRAALEGGRKYDLICMDIMMPEMDGEEAVGQIRALEEANDILSTRGAKIIMITAVSDIRQVGRCFRNLCDAYLTKPIDLAKLLAQMKSCGLVH